MGTSRKISLSFSVNWLISICVVAVGIILLYALGPVEWRPSEIFGASVAAGSAALIAAFNALDSRTSAAEQARKLAAVALIHRWLDPSFFHAKKNGRETIRHFRDHPTVADQKTHLAADPVLLANLIDVLNLIEAMAIAVETTIADEEILKRFFRSIVLEYWHITGPFIEARRAEVNNPRLFLETQWLFQRWKV